MSAKPGRVPGNGAFVTISCYGASTKPKGCGHIGLTTYKGEKRIRAMLPVCAAAVYVLLLAVILAAGCTGTGSIPSENQTWAETPIETPVPAVTSLPMTTPMQITTIFVNESWNGKTITIPLGQQIKVHLSENSTTGYSWTEFLPKGVKLIKETVIAPDNPFAGAEGGYHEWLLSPKAIDIYTFKAVYHRLPGEVKPSDETYTLVIAVTRK